LYPKFGPGQMWEEVARRVREMGGEILTGRDVREILIDGNCVTGVRTQAALYEGDYFFSTMPVQELIAALSQPTPPEVREVSDGLIYRDFIAVGLLVDKLKVGTVRDNWIYIQEPDVLAGRLQIFNNWSPYLVADPGKVWIGVEYFCYEGDEL